MGIPNWVWERLAPLPDWQLEALVLLGLMTGEEKDRISGSCALVVLEERQRWHYSDLRKGRLGKIGLWMRLALSPQKN